MYLDEYSYTYGYIEYMLGVCNARNQVKNYKLDLISVCTMSHPQLQLVHSGGLNIYSSSAEPL